MKNNKDLDYSRLLDTLNGYSILELNNKSYYFKHFSLLQTLEVEGLKTIDIKKSIKTGIKTEEDLIKRAYDTGAWTKNEEEKIKSLEWTIKQSTSSLSKIQDPKQREIFDGQINKQREELKSLSKKRASIVSYSAEHLAEAKKVKRMTKMSLFKDPDFTDLVDDDERTFLTGILFSTYSELNSRDNLLKATWNAGFFDLFCAQNGSCIDLLGCCAKDITVIQKGLLVVSNSLLNKLKNTKIPDEIYGDPVKMFEYEEKEEKEAKTSHGVEDLRQKMRARDGKLKAEDFLS